MCDKCGMTFYHNSNLKKHIETVHASQHKVRSKCHNNPIKEEVRFIVPKLTLQSMVAII